MALTIAAVVVLIQMCCNLYTTWAGQYIEGSTISGTVRGNRVKLPYSREKGMVTDTVDEWLGVPYGQAERWEVSSFPDPWDGVKDCTRLGPVCPQPRYYSQTLRDKQAEDCLLLNIYSPLEEGSPDTLYPVMVFIHGGSYRIGTGNRYNGKVLASHGVVVVTINYRLGELGYMTTGDETLAGNYGLQDQILAVRWVNENIERFRGNSSSVTLFGNSAGASSVGILMTTPDTQGLFHRAIIQSGSPLSYWSVHKPHMDLVHVLNEVAGYVDCHHHNVQQNIDCLKAKSHLEISSMDFQVKSINPSELIYKPRVDGTVLPNLPEKSFRLGKYHHVDVMIGVVRDEWAHNAGWFFDDMENEDIDKSLEDGLDRLSFQKIVHHVIQKRFRWPAYIADVVMQYYTNTTHAYDQDANRQGYVDFMSDVSMFSPSIKLASILSDQQESVYFYVLDHHPEHTEHEWWGAYHELELDYVFGSAFSGYNIAVDEVVEHGEVDRRLSSHFMNIWAHFARHGNPNADLDIKTPMASSPTKQQSHNVSDKISPINGSQWEPYDRTYQYYLFISSTDFQLKQRFRETETFLWNSLVPRLLQSPWQPLHHGDNDITLWIVVAMLVVVAILLVILLLKYLKLRRKMLAFTTDTNIDI